MRAVELRVHFEVRCADGVTVEWDDHRTERSALLDAEAIDEETRLHGFCGPHRVFRVTATTTVEATEVS